MQSYFTSDTADGPPRYRILNFQLKSNIYKWVEIGTFDEKTGLSLDMSMIKFRGGTSIPPTSSCRPKCSFDSIRQINPGVCVQQCWLCLKKCTKYQIVNKDENRCEACKNGTVPSADKSTCLPIPLEYLSYEHPVAIAAIIVAGIGVISTITVIAIFVKHRETAVVRASGRELSFLLLLGILLSYSMTFILCTKPNSWLCGLQKAGVPTSFSMCYAALLIKTNRIERIFRAGRKTVKRPKFISPLSQVILFGIVMTVQFVLLGIWLYVEPPAAEHHFPSREKHQLVCYSLIGYHRYVIGLIIPALLVIVCTVYAFLTRNIPEGFNESKHIGFGMYSTCIIWLGFVPCYISTSAMIQIRIATLCFSISLSATVALCCLFLPKLYIIILHPELNVRQSMMAKSSVKQSNTTTVDTSNNNHHLTVPYRSVNHNTVDTSTQSDIDCQDEVRPMLNTNNSCSDDEDADIQRQLADSNTQTSFYSLKSIFGIDLSHRNKKVYLLSEVTDEVQL